MEVEVGGNMKKLFNILIFGLFSMSLWAVWEGNAGVGNPRGFSEKGMFVKSDMFPYNTLIEIENLENGKKTTAFVSGSSGIAGLLISLSPDVANALDVPSDKIVRVRIEMTSTLSDDFVDEGDYLSSDADYNPALDMDKFAKAEDKKTYSDSDTVLFDPASVKKYPKPGTPVQKPTETPKPVIPEPEVKPEPEVEVEPEIPVEVPIVTPDKAYLERAGMKPPKPQVKNKKPATKTETTTTTTTQVITEVPAPTKVEPSLPRVETPAPKPPVIETPQPVVTKPVETVAGLTEPKKNESKAPPKPVQEIDGIREQEKKNILPAKPVGEVGKVTKPEKEKENPPKPVSDVKTVVQPEKEKSAPSKPVTNVDGITEPKPQKSEASTPVKTIDGITEPKPEPITPVKKVEPVNKVNQQKVEEPKAEKTEIVEPVQTTKQTTKTSTTLTVIDEPEKTIKQTTIIPKVTDLKNISELEEVKVEPYIVQADSQMYVGKLQKGKYYLQIANYSKESNVQSVLAKYSKYPLAIEKLGSGSRTRYRVFVGPLKIDEMGATMEQFYKFGFKDSFFKVIH